MSTLAAVLLTGTHSARPAATAVPAGTLYACSTHALVYQSSGSAWSTWATLGTSGAIVDPMTTRGDIIVRNSSNTTDRLGRGSAGTVLTSDGTDVAWGSPTSSSQRARRVAAAVVSGTPGVATFATAPASTSKLYALIATVVTNCRTVSSITQTNVTWTLMHAKANGTDANVELWKGVPSGTPGTSVSVAFSGSTNAASISVIEDTSGTAGTLDQSADNSGTSTYQASGVITPSAGALTFFLAGVNNGSVNPYLTGSAPWNGVVTIGGSFAACAYAYGLGGTEVIGIIPVQFNGVWANTIVSVV